MTHSSTSDHVAVSHEQGSETERRLHGYRLVIVRLVCLSLAAFFGGFASKPGMDSEEEIVYEKRENTDVTHPKDGRVMSPKFLFGGEKFSESIREPLSENIQLLPAL